jgi:hypothetical protein
MKSGAEWRYVAAIMLRAAGAERFSRPAIFTCQL